MQFIQVPQDGKTSSAGWAPHLDLEPIAEAELALVKDVMNPSWLSDNQENRAIALAASTLVPEHFAEVSGRRISHVDKTLTAVHDRLTNAIPSWQALWVSLAEDAEAGK